MSVISLTGVDNGSKSVTLTAAHSPGNLIDGTAINILGSRWLSSAGFASWTTLGTLTWDGSPSSLVLTATLPSYGGWIFLATVPTVDLTSDPLYLPVVDSGLSAFSIGKAAIVETIKRLNLSRIGDRVYDQIEPHDTLVKYPCCFVVESDGIEKLDEALQSSNATANISYAVKTMIADRKNALTQRLDREWFRKQRQIVRRAFDKQRLADVPLGVWTTVEHGPPWKQSIFPDNQGTPPASYDLLASVLNIRFTVRELRGFLV